MITEQADDVRATLDRETDLLRGAIRLVASGGARSAVIAGLRLAESAMAVALPEAEAAGLTLMPLWRPDEPGRARLRCSCRPAEVTGEPSSPGT